MKGDFSRRTFDEKKHYRRVLMQQGRVQLDSDWNEQIDINLHYFRSLAQEYYEDIPARGRAHSHMVCNYVRY